MSSPSIQLPPGFEDAQPAAPSPSAPLPSSSSPAVQLPLGYEDAQPVQASTNQNKGPDLRPQRINQRTGQPTTLEDPGGVDRIPSDPNFASNTAKYGLGSAALAGGVVGAPALYDNRG
jgi:hypothetical protein